MCAAYLAKAGHKVCVLERRHVLGGCATTEALWPGYKVSTAAYVISLFLPQIIRELKLKEYGLTILPRNPSSFTPLPDGRSLLMGRGSGTVSPRDFEVQRARCRRLSEIQRVSRTRGRGARTGAKPGGTRSIAAAGWMAQHRLRQTHSRRQKDVVAVSGSRRTRQRFARRRSNCSPAQPGRSSIAGSKATCSKRRSRPMRSSARFFPSVRQAARMCCCIT